MIVIQEKRNGGKTAKLIDLLLANRRALLLVYSEKEATRIIRHIEAEPLGPVASRVMSWDRYGRSPQLHGRPLLIDNVDIFLRERFHNIQAVSINED